MDKIYSCAFGCGKSYNNRGSRSKHYSTAHTELDVPKKFQRKLVGGGGIFCDAC